LRCKSRSAFLLTLVLVCISAAAVAAQSGGSKVPWQQKLDSALPLMGHRNWILIVDSAYPLQTSPGIETIETNSGQLEVIKAVMRSVGRSIHVTPNIFMDAELPYVPEKSSPGVTAYRKQIAQMFHGRDIHSLPHEQVIAKIDEVGKTFHILVLKTTMAIPYTSVFLQLDCKYWTPASEKELRDQMSSSPQK
jgi:RbsD / FucU transport protein family